VRTPILVWSSAGGLLLGVFIDVFLAGAVMVAVSTVPGLVGRQAPRWALICAALLLVAIPLASGALGFLEGRLKLS
jgi:hypothetical protein